MRQTVKRTKEEEEFDALRKRALEAEEEKWLKKQPVGTTLKAGAVQIAGILNECRADTERYCNHINRHFEEGTPWHVTMMKLRTAFTRLSEIGIWTRPRYTNEREYVPPGKKPVIPTGKITWEPLNDFLDTYDSKTDILPENTEWIADAFVTEMRTASIRIEHSIKGLYIHAKNFSDAVEEIAVQFSRAKRVK